MEQFTFFWGGVFSNWYPAEFTYKGQKFANTEQAFMWEKAIIFNDDETAEEILKTSNPKEAKALGRKVKNFSNEVWDANKIRIMYDVNKCKYEQNPVYYKELMEHERFVECSPVDFVWGIGMDEKTARRTEVKEWPGQNLLGKVLNSLREFFLNEEKCKYDGQTIITEKVSDKDGNIISEKVEINVNWKRN